MVRRKEKCPMGEQMKKTETKMFQFQNTNREFFNEKNKN